MPLFPDEPVQPRPIPQVEQMNRHSERYDEQRPERKRHAISHAKPRSMWPLFAFLGCGFMLFMFLIVVGVGLWVWSAYGTDDSGESNQTIVTSNPAEHFIVNYKSGLSQLYAEAADKARAGDFKDIKEARDYFQPNMESIKKQSFAKMGQALDSINGANWSNDAAADLFETFSEGLR